jgi:hypothetical protein
VRYSEISAIVKNDLSSLLYHKFKPTVFNPDVAVFNKFNLFKIEIVIDLSSKIKLKAKK